MDPERKANHLALLQVCTVTSDSNSEESASEGRSQLSLESRESSSQESHALVSQEGHSTETDKEQPACWQHAVNAKPIFPAEVMFKYIKLIEQDLSVAVSSGNTYDESLCQSLIGHIDELMNHTDIIDNAIDFDIIGGFAVLHPLLEVPHPVVKAKTLELIAELVQNNTHCQHKALGIGLLPKLFEELESTDESVCVKALYAISCFCRSNFLIMPHLLEVGGPQKLLHTLQIPNDKILTKATFLLTRLMEQFPEMRDILFNLQAVQILVFLLHDEFKPSHEYVLSALLALVSKHEPSRQKCSSPELCLKDCIMTHLSHVQEKPEFWEINEYLNQLLSYCDRDEKMKTGEEMER